MIIIRLASVSIRNQAVSTLDMRSRCWLTCWLACGINLAHDSAWRTPADAQRPVHQSRGPPFEPARTARQHDPAEDLGALYKQASPQGPRCGRQAPWLHRHGRPRQVGRLERVQRQGMPTRRCRVCGPDRVAQKRFPSSVRPASFGSRLWPHGRQAVEFFFDLGFNGRLKAPAADRAWRSTRNDRPPPAARPAQRARELDGVAVFALVDRAPTAFRTGFDMFGRAGLGDLAGLSPSACAAGGCRPWAASPRCDGGTLSRVANSGNGATSRPGYGCVTGNSVVDTPDATFHRFPEQSRYKRSGGDDVNFFVQVWAQPPEMADLPRDGFEADAQRLLLRQAMQPVLAVPRLHTA